MVVRVICRERSVPSPWSDSLKTETTQPELTQQPVAHGGTGMQLGDLGTSRDGQLHGMHPDTHPAHVQVSHQLGAFWCLLLSQRELPSGAEAGGAQSLPQEGLCLRQGKGTGTVPPKSLSAAQQSCLHAQRPAAVYS